MIKKLIIFFGILCIFFVSGYSISTCSTTISIPGNYNLTQNISTSGTCIAITSNNVTLDCQGYAIEGSSPSGDGINVAAVKNNVTIKNCIIKDFTPGSDRSGIDIEVGSNNINIVNVSLINNVYGIDGWNNYDIFILNSTLQNNLVGLYFWSLGYSNFSNILINNSDKGIHAWTSFQNNYFKNVTITNSVSYGLYFDQIQEGGIAGTGENLFENLNISKNGINIQMINPTGHNYSMVFKDSYLGNFSKIDSTNWSLTETNFYGNSFLAGTAPSNECFDVMNLICNDPFPISYVAPFSVSVTSLSSFGFWSSAVSFVLLFGFLFF